MHLLRNSILLVIVLLVSFSLLAQDRCGVEAHRKYLAIKDTNLIKAPVHQSSLRGENLRIAADDKIYRIPVVVHVIWNSAASNISDEVINSQIKVLNDDFRRLNADTVNTFDIFKPVAGDAKFEFFLAQVDPDGNPTTGIIRKYTSRSQFGPEEVDTAVKSLSFWPHTQYLNIWVSSLVYPYLGVGTDPDGVYNDTLTAEGDGIVIDYKAFGINNYTYNLGRTVTHEVGHWLSLLHLWGDANYCGDDYVADTPTQDTDGEDISKSCEAGMSYRCGDTIQYMSDNYMIYSPDKCMNIFTKGQIARMRYVMETNSARIAIQSSPALANITGVFVSSSKNLPLIIYPNPSNGEISFKEFVSDEENLDISFFDRMGKEVLSFQDATLKKQSYDISSLPNGMYLIKVISSQEVYQTSVTLLR